MKITKKVDDYGTVRYTNEQGKLHREDGPAREYANGDKFWCINDKLHREDSPAIEWADGSKEWWINGKRHREDGPAIEYVSGHKVWWINDIEYSEQEFNDYILRKRLQRIMEL